AAVSCALTCVALTRVVGRSAPPRRTIELLLKFVPFTVNVNAASPAVLLAGTMVVTVGAGLLTVRLTTLVEGPPAGAGLKTTTGYVPAIATSAAVSCAINCVALTSVVGRSTAPRRTMELLLKLLPFTVNANAASPAVLLVGAMLASVGTGLLTVRLVALEAPPAGNGLK